MLSKRIKEESGMMMCRVEAEIWLVPDVLFRVFFICKIRLSVFIMREILYLKNISEFQHP